MIENNLDIIKGKRVLDIASHDGRWSFSALKNGAKSVVGIEGRKHLVDNANNTFQKYNIPKDDYQFITGDVHEEIRKLTPSSFDTVFCFGFFYHTIHHFQLLKEIARLNPENIILDTTVSKHTQPIIKLDSENSEQEGRAIKDADNIQVLVGIPSVSTIELMLKNLGYQTTETNWEKFGITNWNDIQDYSTKHITLRNKLGWIRRKIFHPSIIGSKRVTMIAKIETEKQPYTL